MTRRRRVVMKCDRWVVTPSARRDGLPVCRWRAAAARGWSAVRR